MKVFYVFAAVLAASAEGASLRETAATQYSRYMCISEDSTCADAEYAGGSYIAVNKDGNPLMASKYFVCLNAGGRKQEHLTGCEHAMSGKTVRFGCSWWDGSSAYGFGIPVDRLMFCDSENSRRWLPSSGRLEEWPEAEHQ